MSRPVLVLSMAFAVACTGSPGDGEGREPEAAPTDTPRIGAAVIESAIALTAPPQEGAGPVPTFAWEPVEGVATYRLGVVDGDGNATWAWEGAATSVVLGGVPDRRPEEGGPVVTPGSAWSVVALDEGGTIVAISPWRRVSP
jgi:hypothetical protein